MRVPLADVLAWPEEHVRLQLAMLAKEPPPGGRIEHAVAQLSALTFNMNRGKGAAALSASDFMAPDPWKSPEASAGITAEEKNLMGQLSRNRPA